MAWCCSPARSVEVAAGDVEITAHCSMALIELPILLPQLQHLDEGTLTKGSWYKMLARRGVGMQESCGTRVF